MSGNPDKTDKVDLKALIAEAQATAYNPRGGRCWLLHDWSMWDVSQDETLQLRRCLRCGKRQRRRLPVDQHTRHVWQTDDCGQVVGRDQTLPIGKYYDQTCTTCGEKRRITTFTAQEPYRV